MFKDDSARVPFAVIGVLLIIISTVTAVYLMRMEAAGVSNAIADEREGELNDALACARADVDNSLNVACIYAEEAVGENPVVNASGGRSPEEANLARLEHMAYRNFSGYLAANYDGGFAYGDYAVDAAPAGDISFEPVTMELARTVFHPVIQCEDEYAAYYVASVPVELRVTRPGSNLDYTETYAARALVTSRYPLLKNLTSEYEARLNGTPMFLDLTAASFAYTWARGYCQYFTGEPANIVDNNDLSLVTNAASLLEQGCVFNSVDPVSLASLVKHTYDNTQSTTEVLNDNSLSYINQYNFSNTSQLNLPSNQSPQEYRFDADAIVDKELRASIADPASRSRVEKAYGCRVHIVVKRRAVSEYYNDTGSVSKESYPLASNEDGTGPFFREVWKAWNNGTIRRTEVVTIDYYAEECSPLNGGNDVLAPHQEVDFYSGGRTYEDSNLARAVDAYHQAVPVQDILFNAPAYPDGFAGRTATVTCDHNEWVENASVTEIKDLAARIKRDVAVTLSVSDYGSYDDMMDAAYGKMRDRFRQNYTSYLAEPAYREDGVFKTCGAKYAYYQRKAFLGHIDDALNASVNASEEVDKKIDERLKDYSKDMNSSTVKENARTSKDFLDNTKMFIPFGLNMTLKGGESKDDPYKWEEAVALAIDQRPNYLGVEEYVDPETGYRTRPLKVRNVCVFTLPTDLVDTGAATEAVLDGIDAISGSAYRLANDTVAAETSQVTKDLSEQAKKAITDQVNDALVHDQDLQGQLTRGDVESSVNQAFGRRTPEQAVGDMKNGTLQREIAEDLARKARGHAEQELAKKTNEYVDSYGDYIEGKAEEAILGAEEKALSYAIDAMSGTIKQAFKDFMAAAADKAGDAVVGAALKRIPAGLPLLPPWGWWATLNVWYIEIKGEIPYLAVYDTDNEPVPDAILGQRATVYVRRPTLDIRDEGETFGSNEPVRFHIQTCTFIVVPPGPQGIGDKLGGWEEKSPGFDEVAA